MVLDPIPQPLPVHFFGSRPQPPTSPLAFLVSPHICRSLLRYTGLFWEYYRPLFSFGYMYEALFPRTQMSLGGLLAQVQVFVHMCTFLFGYMYDALWSFVSHIYKPRGSLSKCIGLCAHVYVSLHVYRSLCTNIGLFAHIQASLHVYMSLCT